MIIIHTTYTSSYVGAAALRYGIWLLSSIVPRLYNIHHILIFLRFDLLCIWSLWNFTDQFQGHWTRWRSIIIFSISYSYFLFKFIRKQLFMMANILVVCSIIIIYFRHFALLASLYAINHYRLEAVRSHIYTVTISNCYLNIYIYSSRQHLRRARTNKTHTKDNWVMIIIHMYTIFIQFFFLGRVNNNLLGIKNNIPE